MATLKQAKTVSPVVIEMNASRVKAIAEYLELQPKYVELYNKTLVSKFSIVKEQEELDIDNMSKDQMTVLDNIKSDKERDRVLAKMPKAIRDYETHLVAPYYIGDSEQRTDISISVIKTSIIQMINKRTQEEINPFLQFLTK